MDRDASKRSVAAAAFEAIRNTLSDDTVLGIGTGSTVNCFIDELIRSKVTLRGLVSSSAKSSALLQTAGYSILNPNIVCEIPLYVDSADEVDPSFALIKGGGGALTREKFVASLSTQFLCIVDESKLVPRLGSFPLPIEVMPFAVESVVRAMRNLGGNPRARSGFTTDNGNVIVDVEGLRIDAPGELESHINNVIGTVCNGIFAVTRPQRVLVSRDTEVEELSRNDP